VSDANFAAASNQDDASDRVLRRAAEATRIPGNALTLLRDGPEVFAAWLGDIATAQRFILLENYIFSSDRIGTKIAEALIARARAGIEVYVLYDWFGCLETSRQFWLRMKHSGVKVRAFQPFSFSAPLHSVQRNHRKALCIDGVIGHIGGVCIGDAWAGGLEVEGAEPVPPWRDTAVRIVGPAAFELCLAFDDTWGMCGPALPSRLFEPPEPLAAEDTLKETERAPVRVVAGLPARSRIYRLTQVLFTNATSRIWVTDAYFLTPPAMYEALVSAARDGVDVRVLVPGRSDLPWIAWMGRAGYAGLLEAGVRVFEWDGPMLHAKSTVVDGKWCRIGSSNLNLASLLTNWELDVVIEDSGFSAAMEQMFLRDLGQATELVLRATRLRVSIQRADEPEKKSSADSTGQTNLKEGRRRALPGRPGAAVARAGAIMLGAALRRQYERSTVSVSMAAAFTLLGLAALAFFYPTGFSLGLAVMLLWLGLGALLRAITELFQRRSRKRRRRRNSAHGGGSSSGSRTITGLL
jgi:cardiolipin synthase